jgi:biotin operon repressor
VSESIILNLLKNRTKQYSISRKELVAGSCLTDRKVRVLISELQSKGYPIISLGQGYWMASGEELEAYKRRETRRAVTILNKLRKLIPNVSSIVKQLELEI